jgi:hypothetical protein
MGINCGVNPALSPTRPPPGGAAWGKRHNVITLSPTTTARESRHSREATQGHGLTWVTLHAVKCSDIGTFLDKANHLAAIHKAPAAYLRRSTGNLITWPPAWPPWGAPTLAATHAFHRASKASWDGELCCIAHPPGLAQGLDKVLRLDPHGHRQISQIRRRHGMPFIPRFQ